MDPNNTAVLDSYASFLFDMDDFDKAKKLLEKSIAIDPNEHFSKWMQMGQLLNGTESIKCFEKGISLLQMELQKCQVLYIYRKHQIQSNLSNELFFQIRTKRKNLTFYMRSQLDIVPL